MNLFNNFGFYGQDSNKIDRELSQRRQMGQFFLILSKWILL